MTKKNCLSYQIFRRFNQVFFISFKIVLLLGGEERGREVNVEMKRMKSMAIFFGNQKKDIP